MSHLKIAYSGPQVVVHPEHIDPDWRDDMPPLEFVYGELEGSLSNLMYSLGDVFECEGMSVTLDNESDEEMGTIWVEITVTSLEDPTMSISTGEDMSKLVGGNEDFTLEEFFNAVAKLANEKLDSYR